ncbi:MAG TPA: hypothetical protein PK131_02515 [Candidatus Woesebacteria bacterium]|nr:hypothetical protein [Candidatus Woesebacteria bacterium]HRS23009.1 hypothetical protein [Candidatus Woesebacteria bacterium]HRT40192.1 hypothetical protein [Candidatus Woesebacteria bacterium]
MKETENKTIIMEDVNGTLKVIEKGTDYFNDEFWPDHILNSPDGKRLLRMADYLGTDCDDSI